MGSGCWDHETKRKIRSCRACKAAYMRDWRKTPKGILCTFRHNHDLRFTRIETAKSAVYVARRDGKLQPPSQFKCVDCGEIAKNWEHRDYKKPLMIEPVCVSCNQKRGPGENRSY